MNDKIKNLLATAYKTDSIAKNKWRIENREQLREQRKRELKELMEKDNEMSNNKQSSVEMIEEFLLSHCNPTICNVEWSDFKLMLEQAKAMHKEEIEKAFKKGMVTNKTFEDYYNETFNK